jgi:beta-glucosidase/6-phospho-beta-glucosidase/beta-galactosidase
MHSFLLGKIKYSQLPLLRKNSRPTIDPFMLAQEDVNLMKGLNFDAYRFSISWSRIFPGILDLAGL